MGTIKRTKASDKKTNLVVHDIRLINVDRTMKDIGKWRNALINAESIYYPNRTRLYDVYADVLLDGHLTGIINKRMDAVLNKEMSFVMNDKEVEGMEDFLHSGVFRDIVTKILETKFWGISGMEFIPGETIEFEAVPRKHIKPEKGIIVLDQSSYEGIEYKNIPNLWIIGKKRDFGLLLQCSPYALYKKGDFGDWAQYVEIFGQPIRVAKYDANDIKTKLELKTAIDEAGSSLAIMIPKQAEFEIMDGKISNADGQLQERLKNACNDEMSILILGNTETTSNTNGGSNAKAKEHGKQQLEVTKSDMAFLLTQLNCPEFINILKSYGLPVEGGHFKFEKEIDLTELTQKINIDVQLYKLIPVDDDYLYDTYAIPKPADYDAKRKVMDERMQAELQSKNANPGNDPKPPAKPEKKPKNKDVKLSFWDKFRLTMADFFGPAHKD